LNYKHEKSSLIKLALLDNQNTSVMYFGELFEIFIKTNQQVYLCNILPEEKKKIIKFSEYNVIDMNYYASYTEEDEMKKYHKIYDTKPNFTLMRPKTYINILFDPKTQKLTNENIYDFNLKWKIGGKSCTKYDVEELLKNYIR
jgi:hypothetical protein